MPKLSQDAYDAVIIGAGIGGLVCGCYLAKAGMKVLIAEQHHKPGGYCTSFKRQGFTFPAAAHFIGGFKHGNLQQIFEDHDIFQKMTLKRTDPSNIIMTPQHKISFWEDPARTIEDFQVAFPDEKDNIRDFIYSLLQPDRKASIGMRAWSFKNLIDKYFANEKLKTALCLPLFGNAALPPSRISAFIGAKIFREFLLDGGYYPDGGIQKFPDAFAERFEEYGGTLRLCNAVKKICVEKQKATGIVLENNEYIAAKYVISNCDARQTFLKLLGKNVTGQQFSDKIRSMVPSLSGFIVYMGFDDSLKYLPNAGVNIWKLSHVDISIEAIYELAKKGNYRDIASYLFYLSTDRKTALAFLVAPFATSNYWQTMKELLIDRMVANIEADLLPGLSNHLKFKGGATPLTLYRYTGNFRGAAFGWACTPDQLALTDFRKPSFVQGLYLSGHWSTKGFGIPGVIYIGQDTAMMILRKHRHCNFSTS